MPADKWSHVCILGSGAVGKTSLATRYTKNVFEDLYQPTVEDSFRTRITVDRRSYCLDIVDTAGQQEYSQLRDVWMTKGDAFILAYSVSSRNSFKDVAGLHRDLVGKKGNVACVLVSTKCDLDQRQVSFEDGLNLARELNAPFFETSAKSGENVDEVFEAAIREMRASRSRRNSINRRFTRGSRSNSDAPPPPPSAAADGKKAKKQKKNKQSCLLM